MSTAANVVIADAQATPVNHTFQPQGKDSSGTFWFTDLSQANAVGYWKISVEIKKPPPATDRQSSQGRTYRYRIGLHQPILANVTNSTVSGIAPAPTLAYSPRTFVEFILPEETALLDRSNAAKMVPLLLQNSQFKSLIEQLDTFS